MKLQSQREWRIYCKSGKKPDDIPANPNRKYKKEWKGIGDWLGTDYIATYHRKYLDFKEARKLVQKLKFKTGTEWKAYCKSGRKPEDIPATPERKYKKEWKGIGDWLGTGYIAPKDRMYKSFEESRAFVRQLKLKNGTEWKKYRKSADKPRYIPNYPQYVYKNQWKGIDDWLDTYANSLTFNQQQSQRVQSNTHLELEEEVL